MFHIDTNYINNIAINTNVEYKTGELTRNSHSILYAHTIIIEKIKHPFRMSVLINNHMVHKHFYKMLDFL